MTDVDRALAEELCVIVPTRGRRAEALRLIEAWGATRAVAQLVLGVDEDDIATYPLDIFGAVAREHDIDLRIEQLPRTSMCGTLNALAVQAAGDYRFVGFMGDDHVPRTPFWDQRIARTLIRPCAVTYGNDLFQGPNLPTQVFMDARIVNTLGYMAPPTLKHLFLDNAWKTWGEYLDSLVYLPDVVIEHLHPQAGKADWDEGHKRVNGSEMWDHDRDAWGRYNEEGLGVDCARLVEAARTAA